MSFIHFASLSPTISACSFDVCKRCVPQAKTIKISSSDTPNKLSSLIITGRKTEAATFLVLSETTIAVFSPGLNISRSGLADIGYVRTLLIFSSRFVRGDNFFPVRTDRIFLSSSLRVIFFLPYLRSRVFKLRKLFSFVLQENSVSLSGMIFYFYAYVVAFFDLLDTFVFDLNRIHPLLKICCVAFNVNYVPDFHGGFHFYGRNHNLPEIMLHFTKLFLFFYFRFCDFFIGLLYGFFCRFLRRFLHCFLCRA